jgi:type II secretory pathway pseudopilin PulG
MMDVIMPHISQPCRSHTAMLAGFSLAELLITLALLGLMASMMIPTVLNSAQTGKTGQHIAVVKDTALQLAAAWQTYRKTGYRNVTGTATVTAGSTSVTGSGTAFTTQFAVGDSIQTAGGQIRTITAIGSATSITVNQNWDSTETSVGIGRIRVVNGLVTSDDIMAQLTTIAATDTSTNPSSVPSGETALDTCSSPSPCAKLTNGGWLQYKPASTFNSTASWHPLHYISFALDPDGDANTAGKISFRLYANGRIVTGNTAITGEATSASPLTVIANPSWLSVTDYEK